ncbi:MobA/MobL family protein [Bacillus sp. 1P06AnD]|uniref:MobA/MobL family protein n=1 Tax=Bacillus sp. 1P06AnD TaxID=3132208 RepID=UPI0039A2D6C1
MSLYYMHAQYVSKKTQSAVAKAAYVSNDSLYSERDDSLKRYKVRTVPPESFIIAPTHAPEWVYDRERLWNEVEKVEKQFNAQVLREVVIALPVEMDWEMQRDLVREYVQENFVEMGMVADVNIHRDKDHNPHAHILLTLRPFNEDGTWWKTKSKKVYLTDEKGKALLNDQGKQKTKNIDLTGWNSKENLSRWRKNLSIKINEFYIRKGIDASVSHKTYAEQGLDIQPKQRLSRSEYYVEKQAELEAKKEGKEYHPVTYFGRVNREIELANNEIKKLEKEIAQLEKISVDLNHEKVEQFDKIRQNIKFSKEQFSAIQFVETRGKVDYVDFQTTKKVYDSLNFWKRKLDKTYRALQREEKALNVVNDYRQKSSENIVRYGFVNENFDERFTGKLSVVKDGYTDLTKQVSQFKDALEKSIIAHEIQTDILKQEFVFLYPQYENITNIKSDELLDIMNEHVQLFKNERKVLQEIDVLSAYPDFVTQEEQDFRKDICSLIESYKTHSAVHFKIPKLLNEQERDYLNLVKLNKDILSEKVEKQEEVYNKAISYLITKGENQHNEKQYEEVKNKVLNSLISLYGIEQRSILEQLPDRIKVKLLEKFIEDKEVDSLHADLSEIDWKLREKRQDREFEGKMNKEFNFAQQSSVKGSAGGLLSDLIDQAKENENKYDDLEKKRKRAKNKGKGGTYSKGELLR